MSLNSTLLIASSGLDVIDRQLALVSQNVANAGTAGYVKESQSLSSLSASGIEMGVRSGPIQLDLDAHLQAAAWQAQSDASAAGTTLTALSAVNQVAGSTGGSDSIADDLGALQDEFSALETAPGDQATQEGVVDQAQQLAGAINRLADAGTAQRQAAQDAVVTQVGQLNQALGQIGAISSQIAQAKATGQNTDGLEQSRLQQMSAVTNLVGMRFVAQPNGGMQGIVGGIVLQLDDNTGKSGAVFQVNPGQLTPGTASASIITTGGQNVTEQLANASGSIGANLQIRDTAMPQMQAELDEFAHTLASRFDAQGLRLFTDASGTVPGGGDSPAVQASPNGGPGYLGFAQVIQVNPAVAAKPGLIQQGTTGSSSASGSTAIVQNVLNYALGKDSGPGVAQPPPATAGLGANGTINARFAPPATLADFATAIGTAQAQAYAAASTASDTETATATAMQSRLSASSGVSMDTELTNMIALQNAYGANAKVVTTAESMWTNLLDMVTP